MSSNLSSTEAVDKANSHYPRFLELELELEQITERIREIGNELADMQADAKFKRLALRAGNTEPLLVRELHFLEPDENDDRKTMASQPSQL
jgi:uncharacterized protein YydD (DUF2326 family)